MSAIVLPWPPAVNNLYMNIGKRRIRTKRYDAWLSEALTAVREQQSAPVRGSFNIAIICERPDRRVRDIDGLAKAPLDLLVKAGLIDDDSLAQQLTIGWSPNTPAKPGCVRITLEAA